MAAIKFFAGFREKTRKGEIKIKIGKTISLAKFIELLCKEFPELERQLKEGEAIIAVNREVADKSTKIKDKDEIAIFPPVSGG